MQLIEIILKAVASVGIIYALLIPSFKHHYVVKIIDSIGFGLIVLSSAILCETTNYLAVGIVMGCCLIVYAVVSFLTYRRNETWLMMFNLNISGYEAVKATLMSNPELLDDELKESIHWVKWPFILIKPTNKKTVKELTKPLETAIKTQKAYPFYVQYGLFLLVFILLILIWRY